MQSSRTYKIYSEVLWAKRNNYCPVDMNILLTGELAEFQYARRIAYTDQKIVDKEVEEWLDLKIIKYFRVCFTNRTRGEKMDLNGCAATIAS